MLKNASTITPTAETQQGQECLEGHVGKIIPRSCGDGKAQQLRRGRRTVSSPGIVDASAAAFPRPKTALGGSGGNTLERAVTVDGGRRRGGGEHGEA